MPPLHSLHMPSSMSSALGASAAYWCCHDGDWRCALWSGTRPRGYLSTSARCTITFLIVRSLKDSVIKWLGPHADTWRRLDAAITREGLYICFLWRVAPIAPYVVSSAMISMTNISMWDYTWTTALGIIPSSFPIVSGEQDTALCNGLKLASLGPLPYSSPLVPTFDALALFCRCRDGRDLLDRGQGMDPLTLTINVLV